MAQVRATEKKYTGRQEQPPRGGDRQEPPAQTEKLGRQEDDAADDAASPGKQNGNESGRGHGGLDPVEPLDCIFRGHSCSEEA